MANEGDALALLLNRKPKSRIARWLAFFRAQRQVEAQVSDPGISGARAHAILEQVAAAKQKPVRVPKDYPPSRFNVSFTLQPFIRPTGEYDCRVLPKTGGYAETMLLLQLANAHQAHRLRQCEHCQKWYFARREAQRFCSVNCRVKGHASREPVEVRRRKRVEYMRKYRAQLKANPNLKIRENQPKGERQR